MCSASESHPRGPTLRRGLWGLALRALSCPQVGPSPTTGTSHLFLLHTLGIPGHLWEGWVFCTASMGIPASASQPNITSTSQLHSLIAPHLHALVRERVCVCLYLKGACGLHRLDLAYLSHFHAAVLSHRAVGPVALGLAFVGDILGFVFIPVEVSAPPLN